MTIKKNTRINRIIVRKINNKNSNNSNKIIVLFYFTSKIKTKIQQQSSRSNNFLNKKLIHKLHKLYNQI